MEFQPTLPAGFCVSLNKALGGKVETGAHLIKGEGGNDILPIFFLASLPDNDWPKVVLKENTKSDLLVVAFRLVDFVTNGLSN